MTEPQPFDVCGPLPTGTTVLEASAGTGKTFAIAALATRYVADGLPIDDLLLVTFTRMATGELRERVRERFLTAERGLTATLAGEPVDPADPADEVLALLADGDPAEVERRRDRLAAALRDFDAASITTTHGFCHQMLAGLGVTGDVEPDAEVVERITDLVDEVVDDRYLKRALAGAVPPFDLATARSIAKAVLDNPRTPLSSPTIDDRTSPPWLRVRLALTVRQEVERRKRRAGVITYDDLLTRLADALHDDDVGPINRRRLRDRYRVVLVDEFQDTDELQWQILADAFRHDDCTLVLIGDPKQAIYAFRGADVHAYLDAAGTAQEVHTLATNWRSDADLILAYDAIFRDAALGHPAICYREVSAAPHHRERGLVGAVVPEPVRIRMLGRDYPDVGITPGGAVSKTGVRHHIARDLAADVVDLLSSGATLVHRSDDGSGDHDEPVRPRHLAVLTRTNRDAAIVRDALADAGVPAVIHGAGSVFATPAALDWLRLLEALERPSSDTRARAAAITPFIGRTAADLDAATDAELEELHSTVHMWAGVLRGSGVAALSELIARTTSLAERVLRRDLGERLLTDLRHIGQLLHEEATSARLGVTALTAWMRERIAEAAADGGAEERSRRLESDAEAVQVLTIHACKGLEFPIVYYPYMWEPSWIPDEQSAVVFHDLQADGERRIDVSGSGPAFQQHEQWNRVEQRGEDLRLLYVALTRAKHQAIVWWVPSFDSQQSALGRLVFEREDDGTVPAFGARSPASDERLRERFVELGELSGGRIAFEEVVPGPLAVWSDVQDAPADLTVARFDRSIDTDWRRTSYSSLTADAHEPAVGSEPEQHDRADDEIVPEATLASAPTVGDGDEQLRATPLPLADMPGGARVGTVLHTVLEEIDFTADDLDDALSRHLDSVLLHRPTPVGDIDVVRGGLRAALDTPLGPLLDDRTLSDVPTTDRLDELNFELPIAGGDSPTGSVDMGAIADLLAAHLGPDDPLHGYDRRLADPALATRFHGFLTGSIDLVVRHRHQFAVVDYKSNHLSGEEPATAWHYRPAALAEAMQHAHYPLQALLYQVALHRYLRWRLADYDPDRNLAGVLYLFLRGMTGPDVPRVDGHPCGVFAWRPPTALVVELSDLLEQGSSR